MINQMQNIKDYISQWLLSTKIKKKKTNFYLYVNIEMCCGTAWPWNAVQLSSDLNLVSDSKKDCMKSMLTML